MTKACHLVVAWYPILIALLLQSIVRRRHSVATKVSGCSFEAPFSSANPPAVFVQAAVKPLPPRPLQSQDWGRTQKTQPPCSLDAKGSQAPTENCQPGGGCPSGSDVGKVSSSAIENQPTGGETAGSNSQPVRFVGRAGTGGRQPLSQLLSAGSDGAAGTTAAVQAGPAQGVVSADGLNEGQREAVHRWGLLSSCCIQFDHTGTFKL